MAEGTISGGRAVVEALLAAGVDHAFCVPGESFLGVLDALYGEPRLRMIATRHEGGAAFMAAAYGRLTGRPATCLGTRMVGGGNLAIGIHTAFQDSAPLIALLGQVATAARHREAFQEVELAQAFAPLVKWAVEPPSAERLGELTLRAARIAIGGRPGPVAIALREEILNQAVPPLGAKPLPRPRPAPEPGLVAEILRLLRAAERPILLLGGGVLAAGASASLVALAEAEQVPVVAAWRRPDVFPNEHPLYLGQSGLGAPSSVGERLLEADLLVVIGSRLNEYASQNYRVPAPGCRFVHVDIDPEGLGAHRQADLACLADAALFAEALLAAARADPLPAERAAARQRRVVALRNAWDEQATPSRGRARPEYVDQQVVMAHLRRTLSPEAVIVTDAGNFSGWPSRYLRWSRPGTFLAPTSGAMGYAVPAAIGAKLANPARPVVAFVGDGGFLMTGTELETAVRENVPLVTLVCDNRQYGTILMHQQREHPNRRIATALGPVDFAAFARSLGALGIEVRDEREFPAAFAEAQAADRPALLHLHVDPEQLSVANDS
jgi:acetolactate synthase I/II/III large subunit